MKVEKIISIVDSIKKNDLSDDAKIVWLNEAEGRIAFEILKMKPDEFRPLASGEDELLAPEPYSKIYTLYIGAMIAFFKGDYNLYNRAVAEYENAFSEYARYVIRNR